VGVIDIALVQRVAEPAQDAWLFLEGKFG